MTNHLLLLVCLLAPAVGHAESAPIIPEHSVTPEGCIIERFVVPSAAMGRSIKCVVVLPPTYATEASRSFPILYALHGRGAPYTTWSEMPPLRAALVSKPMIVASFDGDKQSNYLDSDLPQTTYLRDSDIPPGTTPPPASSRFTTFFFDELMPWIDAHYRTDAQRRMLTGFSMGGYGALRFVLHRPAAFVSVSALSGWFSPCADANQNAQKRFGDLLGPLPEAADRYREADVLLKMEEFLTAGGTLPPCEFYCGSEDPTPLLLESNHTLDQLLTAHGRPNCYHESPGKHDWTYWKNTSAAIIDFHWQHLP